MKILVEKKPGSCDECPCGSNISIPIYGEYRGHGSKPDVIGIKTLNHECTLTGINLSNNPYEICPLIEVNNDGVCDLCDHSTAPCYNIQCKANEYSYFSPDIGVCIKLIQAFKDIPALLKALGHAKDDYNEMKARYNESEKEYRRMIDALAAETTRADEAIEWADILCHNMEIYDADWYQTPEDIAAEYKKWRGTNV